MFNFKYFRYRFLQEVLILFISYSVRPLNSRNQGAFFFFAGFRILGDMPLSEFCMTLKIHQARIKAAKPPE
jgi:hypothetical protein